MLKYAQLTCALALSAAAVSAQAIPASATAETTGMIGVAYGQTAQLNLLNPGVLPPATGVACTATVWFVDASGTVRKSTSVTVNPGTSAPFDLRSDTDLAIINGARVDIRAVIAIPAIPPPTAGSTQPMVPACKLIPTLEIFDYITGRTLVTLGHVEAIPAAPTTNP